MKTRNFQCYRATLKTPNLILAWCICEFSSWSTKSSRNWNYGLCRQKSRLRWAFATFLETCEWLTFPFNGIQSFSMSYLCHLRFFPLGFGRRFFVRNRWRLASEPWIFAQTAFFCANGKVTSKKTHTCKQTLNDSGKTEILFKHFRGPWNHRKKLQGGSILFFVDSEGHFQIFQGLLEASSSSFRDRNPTAWQFDVTIAWWTEKIFAEQCITVKVTSLLTEGSHNHGWPER